MRLRGAAFIVLIIFVFVCGIAALPDTEQNTPVSNSQSTSGTTNVDLSSLINDFSLLFSAPEDDEFSVLCASRRFGHGLGKDFDFLCADPLSLLPTLVVCFEVFFFFLHALCVGKSRLFPPPCLSYPGLPIRPLE